MVGDTHFYFIFFPSLCIVQVLYATWSHCGQRGFHLDHRCRPTPGERLICIACMHRFVLSFSSVVWLCHLTTSINGTVSIKFNLHVAVQMKVSAHRQHSPYSCVFTVMFKNGCIEGFFCESSSIRTAAGCCW